MSFNSLFIIVELTFPDFTDIIKQSFNVATEDTSSSVALLIALSAVIESHNSETPYMRTLRRLNTRGTSLTSFPVLGSMLLIT